MLQYPDPYNCALDTQSLCTVVIFEFAKALKIWGVGFQLTIRQGHMYVSVELFATIFTAISLMGKKVWQEYFTFSFRLRKSIKENVFIRINHGLLSYKIYSSSERLAYNQVPMFGALSSAQNKSIVLCGTETCNAVQHTKIFFHQRQIRTLSTHSRRHPTYQNPRRK